LFRQARQFTAHSASKTRVNALAQALRRAARSIRPKPNSVDVIIEADCYNCRQKALGQKERVFA